MIALSRRKFLTGAAAAIAVAPAAVRMLSAAPAPAAINLTALEEYCHKDVLLDEVTHRLGDYFSCWIKPIDGEWRFLEQHFGVWYENGGRT